MFKSNGKPKRLLGLTIVSYCSRMFENLQYFAVVTQVMPMNDEFKSIYYCSEIWMVFFNSKKMQSIVRLIMNRADKNEYFSIRCLVDRMNKLNYYLFQTFLINRSIDQI